MRITAVDNRQYTAKNKTQNFGMKIPNGLMDLFDTALRKQIGVDCKAVGEITNKLIRLEREVPEDVISIIMQKSGAHDLISIRAKGLKAKLSDPRLALGIEINSDIPTNMKILNFLSATIKFATKASKQQEKNAARNAIRTAARKAFAMSPEGLNQSVTKAKIHKANARLALATAQANFVKADGSLDEATTLADLVGDRTTVKEIASITA